MAERRIDRERSGSLLELLLRPMVQSSQFSVQMAQRERERKRWRERGRRKHRKTRREKEKAWMRDEVERVKKQIMTLHIPYTQSAFRRDCESENAIFVVEVNVHALRVHMLPCVTCRGTAISQTSVSGKAKIDCQRADRSRENAETV